MPTIDDFLVLKFEDAVISGATATWNITPNYYTNQRSSVCFMSLERANINFTGAGGGGDVGTMLRCDINGQNQQISDNVGGCMLDIINTSIQGTSHHAYKTSNSTPMKLLVSARPTTIKISLQHLDFDSYANTDQSYIILRFEYDDLKDTQREYRDQFTKTFM